MKTKISGKLNSGAARETLRRAVCEVLEQRRLLSGLPDATENVADLTVVTSRGAVVTTDPTLQGPLQAPMDGMQVRAQVIQPDGKRLVAGYVNGNWALARYNLDGMLDQSFGWGGKMTTDFGTASDRALNVSVRPDGKIVLMGLISAASDSYQFAITRYTADGSLDTGFGDNGKLLTGIGRAPGFGVVALALKDGRIHVTGWQNGALKAMEWGDDGSNGLPNPNDAPSTLSFMPISITVKLGIRSRTRFGGHR